MACKVLVSSLEPRTLETLQEFALLSSLTSAPSTSAPPRLSTLADGCKFVYLDVGSNIGVQVRKLFEPEKYPGAGVLDLFAEKFGNPEFRRQKDSGVCAFGFEANPVHAAKLLKLSACYNAQGWRTHFFAPGAVAAADGNISFFSDNIKAYEEWSASVYDHSRLGLKVVVPAYDLAQFILRQIAPRSFASANTSQPAAVVMKMDIEGSELTVIPRLLEKSVLCKTLVDFAFLEWHERYVPNEVKPTLRELQVNISRLMADQNGKCTPTSVIELDDETFLHDGQPFPATCNLRIL